MSLATTDKQYYENPEHWGENQFVTLENIIDNIMLLADDDDYLKHLTRPRASILGKQCLKRLKVHVIPERKAIEFQLSSSKTFPYPRFMSNWVRAYVVNSCDKLTTLGVNSSPTVQSYMQSDQLNGEGLYELAFDESGSILRAEDKDYAVGNCSSYTCACTKCSDSTNLCGECSKCYDDSFKNSWIKQNKNGNYFEFSDDLVDELIVLEFISTGLENLDDCDILIPDVLELAVENWIKCFATEGKRNTPDRVSLNYWNRYKLERRRAKPILSSKTTVEAIIRAVSLRVR